jgi:hypothetical protein
MSPNRIHREAINLIARARMTEDWHSLPEKLIELRRQLSNDIDLRERTFGYVRD